MPKTPKHLSWTEPVEVSRHYHPQGAGYIWTWRSIAMILFTGIVLIVLLIDNPDPNAKWVVLAIGAVGAGFVAFVPPVMLRRSGATVQINKGCISRASQEQIVLMALFPPFALWMMIKHGGDGWYWRNIGQLSIAVEEFEGKTRRVLHLYDRELQPADSIGVEDKITNAQIAEWAAHMQKHFVVEAATGATTAPFNAPTTEL